jgi:ubiquinone/menaquinone biosynthesis C-methylase UbiE
MTDLAVPNHHAHYPAFAGAAGLVAAVSMTVGRDDDARLAGRLSAVGPADAVVDVGCGPGAAVRYAAGLGATVTGVDPAPVMLRVARLLTRNPATIAYLAGSAEALPLEDDSATVLWSIATVHHWADLDAGLAEADRVLRPGGRLVVLERRRKPEARGHASHGWTDAQAAAFAQRCDAHGFVGTNVEGHQTPRGARLSVTGRAPA